MANENSETPSQVPSSGRQKKNSDTVNKRRNIENYSKTPTITRTSILDDRASQSKAKERKEDEIKVDIPHLSNQLSKLLNRNTRNFMVKKSIESSKQSMVPKSINESADLMTRYTSQPDEKKQSLPNYLQNLNRQRTSFTDDNELECSCLSSTSTQKQDTRVEVSPSVRMPEHSTKTSLLQSYLFGPNQPNPSREEYVSKKRNVSNSLISSDSVHHSIFLESGRERRQCLLQYLSAVMSDGQVVIYVNSIPGVESLMGFLRKHGFQVNTVHPKMLMAESNWILSEFSLKKFSVLLCAEDHYHSCPAHFRWVKTIINYELPISNPLENWTIRNGIVEFSDTLPVHIYTFVKKTCPLDNGLVKLLRLDSEDQDQQDEHFLPIMTEQMYSAGAK